MFTNEEMLYMCIAKCSTCKLFASFCGSVYLISDLSQTPGHVLSLQWERCCLFHLPCKEAIVVYRISARVPTCCLPLSSYGLLCITVEDMCI